MNMSYQVIANWKLNLGQNEAKWWIDKFSEQYQAHSLIEVGIAPSFTEIGTVAQKISRLRLEQDISIIGQDVSRFEKGKYTGEVGAFQLRGLGVSAVIIGHSERRTHLHESNAMINQKVQVAVSEGLEPIVAVSNQAQVKSLQEVIDKKSPVTIAYEPLEAIGTGHPADPHQVDEFLREVRHTLGDSTRLIYGGSVDASDVGRYLSSEYVRGFLVGGASLDPIDFWEIIKTINNYHNEVP